MTMTVLGTLHVLRQVEVQFPQIILDFLVTGNFNYILMRLGVRDYLLKKL